ncbi:hypothetical protein [Streptomyces formicae]
MTTATYSPAVARALDNIDDAKKTSPPAVAGALDFVADLIKSTGDPTAVFDWVLDVMARERGESSGKAAE